jgi:hypothetical protein
MYFVYQTIHYLYVLNFRLFNLNFNILLIVFKHYNSLILNKINSQYFFLSQCMFFVEVYKGKIKQIKGNIVYNF